MEEAALATAARPAPTEVELKDKIVEITPKRKVIAETLSGSKFSAPHFYLKLTACVEDLMAARDRLNKSLNAHVSVNAFLMKFAAEALKRHPMVNAAWTATPSSARKHRHCTGVSQPAASSPRSPRLRAENPQIDRELKALVEKTRKGSHGDYADSTFTINGLDLYGTRIHGDHQPAGSPSLPSANS